MILEERTSDLNGHELLLRSPREEDAELLIDGLRRLCGETRFLTMEPDEVDFSIEQEIEWIRSHNEGERNLVALGFLDGEYVGNCEFTGGPKRRGQHRVTIGISIFQKFWGMGIGSIYMQTLVDEAKQAGAEMMELRAVASNERAIHLYEKFGFRQVGRCPNYFHYEDGTTAGEVWMIREL